MEGHFYQMIDAGWGTKLKVIFDSEKSVEKL